MVKLLGSDAQVAVGPGLEVKSSLLARNTALNLVGQVIPILVNLAAVPYVVHRLGADRFGMLSLAWLVVGYFALFDFGIGPATTKFVAEFLGRGESHKLPGLVWTAVTSQSCLGSVAAILFALATPTLINRILKIPPDLRMEAQWVFLTLAVSLPIGFATGSLGGVLSASQRFDLLNGINIPTSCLTYLLPAVLLSIGYGLRACVFWLVLVRLVTLLVTLVFCVRLYPGLWRHFGFEWALVGPLLSFGGWITISGIVGPILMYFDRFLIGTLLSVAAIGYYTPPYMITSKLTILPLSLVSTLFPAFSSSAGRNDKAWIRNTLVHSLKLLLFLLGPATAVMIFFSRHVLTLWVGASFAAQGTLLMQILAAGAFINCLALVPSYLLQGIGRPDLTAKFHLIELPLHIAAAWFLVSKFGLPGAGLAWSLRVSLDFVLLMIAACRHTQTPVRVLVSKNILRCLAALTLLVIALTVLWGCSHALFTHMIFTGLYAAIFSLGAWHYVLDREEKCQIRLWLKKSADGVLHSKA